MARVLLEPRLWIQHARCYHWSHAELPAVTHQALADVCGARAEPVARWQLERRALELPESPVALSEQMKAFQALGDCEGVKDPRLRA